MPAVSSPTRARLSFSRSCSSSSTTAVRSVNRQMAPWTLRCLAEQRRHGHAELQRRRRGSAGISIARRTMGGPGLRHSSISAASGSSVRQQIAVIGAPVRARAEAEHTPARRVDDPNLAVEAHDQQTRGQARDDLAAQALRRLGARAPSRVPAPSAWSPLPAAPRTAATSRRRCRGRAARCARRRRPQHRKRQHGHQRTDDGGQAQQCQRVRRHQRW